MPASKTAAARPAAAPRVLWKGAISFGLVHIPVALYPASRDSGIDFDWLDRRSMDPVGYRRINKKTGEEIAREDIVKGIEYQSGRYVVLSDDEIRAAYPRTTQTIEIESFVPAGAIPDVFLERPYYVAPVEHGAKVYALLREALRRTGRIGVARLVIQTKQHLAALMPAGAGLLIDLLRWDADIRPWNDLPLPPEDAKEAGVTERELAMAEQLVESMSGDWQPQQFRDSFKDEIMRLVERKIAAGDTESTAAAPLEEAPPDADVLDLTDLLQRSLRPGGVASAGGQGQGEAPEEEGKVAPGRHPSGKAPASGAAKKPAGPASHAAAKRRRAT